MPSDQTFATDYREIIDTMLTETMAEGTRNGYPDGNWKRKATIQDHLEHIKAHIELAMAGDTTEDHIAHAFTRLAMIRILQTEI